jgi:hypothetical protein
VWGRSGLRAQSRKRGHSEVKEASWYYRAFFGTVDPDYTRGYGNNPSTGGANQELRAFCRGLRLWASDKRYRPVFDFKVPVDQRPDDATCA